MFDQVASRDDGTVNISELDQLCDKIGIEVSSQEVKGDQRLRKVVGIPGSGRERAVPKLPPGLQAPGLLLALGGFAIQTTEYVSKLPRS